MIGVDSKIRGRITIAEQPIKSISLRPLPFAAEFFYIEEGLDLHRLTAKTWQMMRIRRPGRGSHDMV